MQAAGSPIPERFVCVYFGLDPEKIGVSHVGRFMAMADGEKLVKYITEKLVAYMGTPPDKRKAIRNERLQRRESWSYRMFGFIPYAVAQWIRSVKKMVKIR